PEECDRLRGLIFTWNTHVTPLEQDRGHRRATLASLLGAIGKPEDAAVLDRWIQEDAVKDQEPHNRRSWTTWCAGALAKLHCEEAAVVLLRLVGDAQYFGDASDALLHIVRMQEQTLQTQVSFGPDYRRIWHTRRARTAQRGSNQSNSRKVQYAQAIH